MRYRLVDLVVTRLFQTFTIGNVVYRRRRCRLICSGQCTLLWRLCLQRTGLRTPCASVSDVLRCLLRTKHRRRIINLIGALDSGEVHIGRHLSSDSTNAQDRLKNTDDAIAQGGLELLRQAKLLSCVAKVGILTLTRQELTRLINHRHTFGVEVWNARGN